MDIGGKPLILWTAERLREVASEFELFFAVDGEDLGAVLESNGFSVIQTDPDLASGTDRIAAANELIKAKTVINVQADEPLIHREHILSLVESVNSSSISMSTIAVPFENEEDFLDPNQVKVVLDQKGCALYFSRSPIPHQRSDVKGDSFTLLNPLPLKHIGIYAYNAEFLKSFTKSSPGNLEKCEKLEQLRALEIGAKIHVSVMEIESMGIDTLEDFEAFERRMMNIRK